MTPRKAEELPRIIHYPESDGKPMADSTLQYEWITLLHDNIDFLFADEDEVLTVSDVLWYPVEGHPEVCAAPDVMVVFGRPRGHRKSYLQWKEGSIGPQVVFEILSHSNTAREMVEKYGFYERHGVEEYYVYKPGENHRLEGWLRKDGKLAPIEPMHDWVSPRLNIRFDMSRGDLDVFAPNGERFIPFSEVARRRKIAEDNAAAAEQQAALSQLETAAARQQAQEQRRQAEEQRQRAERLAARLRELGIDPDAA